MVKDRARYPTTRWTLAVLLAGLVPAAVRADLPEIRQRGTLRVITVGDPDNAAWRSSARLVRTDGGQISGLEGEILAGFARLHGIRAEIVYVAAWENLLPTLLQGKGDVVGGGLTDTPARRRLVDFTGETFPTRNVVVTRKPHRVVRTLDELRQERIGVSRGTSYIDALTAAGVPPENIDDSFSTLGAVPRTALNQGRITAVVEGVEVALTSDVGDPTFQIGMFLGQRESLAFAVRKQDPLLRAALDEYMSNLRRTPTWNRLVVKYFGEHALEVLKRARQP